MRLSIAVLLLSQIALADEPPYERKFHGDSVDLVHVPAPLPVFTREGAYVLLLVDDSATPRCEEWSIEPGPTTDPTFPRDGKLVRGDNQIDYHSAGERLSVCGHDTSAREDRNELVVGGARWFHDEPSCKRAIARHQRVAMDFRDCTSTASGDERDATRGKFEQVIAHSGSLFVRDKDGKRCDRIQLVTDGKGASSGTWVVDVDDDYEEHHTYSYDDSELYLTEGVPVLKPGRKAPASTGGYSTASVESVPLRFEATLARSAWEDYFLDRSTCEASFALDTKRAAWLPEAR